MTKRARLGTATALIAMFSVAGSATAHAQVGVQAQTSATPQVPVTAQPAPPPQAQPAPVYAQPVYAQPVYAQPMAPPPQPREVSRPILGLAISGGVLLGVSWLIHGLLVSPFAGCDIDGDCREEWRDFRYLGLVPLAGPFLQLATRPRTDGDIWDQYLVIDGVLQIAGATMLILGLSIQTTETVYAWRDGDLELALVPMISPGVNGLAAHGRF